MGNTTEITAFPRFLSTGNMWFLVDFYIMMNVCFHVQNLTVPKEQIVLNTILTNMSKTNLHGNHCSLLNHPCVLAMNFLATHMCKKYVIKYVLHLCVLCK